MYLHKKSQKSPAFFIFTPASRVLLPEYRIPNRRATSFSPRARRGRLFSVRACRLARESRALKLTTSLEHTRPIFSPRVSAKQLRGNLIWWTRMGHVDGGTPTERCFFVRSDWCVKYCRSISVGMDDYYFWMLNLHSDYDFLLVLRVRVFEGYFSSCWTSLVSLVWESGDIFACSIAAEKRRHEMLSWVGLSPNHVRG